jgi:hypothetical protein
LKLEIVEVMMSESLKGKDYLEDAGIDGMILLKWILEK